MTGLDDHCGQVWRINSKDTLPDIPEVFLEGHTAKVASVAFSPCGTFAATGSWDATARLWNVETGTCVHVLRGHEAEVFSVSFSPFGEVLATTSQDGTVRLWSVGAGWCIMTLDGYEAAVRSSAFSPCGRFLAIGSWDGKVQLWDIDTGMCQTSFQASTTGQPIHSIAFSFDGSTIATADGNTARLWNASSGTCIKVLGEHTGMVRSVDISR